MTAPDLRALVAQALQDGRAGLTLRGLIFGHRNEARLLLMALVGFSVVLLVGRMAMSRRPGRDTVVLPAVLAMPVSFGRWLIHLPLLLFLVGLSFLAIAIADPYTALVRREASYPGRRICLTIDASNSMTSAFRTSTLRGPDRLDEAFFTTVAAAERFVQMRMNGRYRDLLALVEFGSDAYVVTPFTNDYDNIMTSLSLIGDPHEFSAFPDQSTVIARGIEQSVELFKTFKFLDASGNLLVIFSDGEDTLAMTHGRSLDDIIQSAVTAQVPVYFVRMNYDKKRGDHIPDFMWAEAVEHTGGKFFAASDERSLLAAIQEIDQVAAGTVRMSEYSAQQPRFAAFASIGGLLFLLAAASKLAIPYFQRFP